MTWGSACHRLGSQSWLPNDSWQSFMLLLTANACLFIGALWSAIRGNDKKSVGFVDRSVLGNRRWLEIVHLRVLFQSEGAALSGSSKQTAGTFFNVLVYRESGIHLDWRSRHCWEIGNNGLLDCPQCVAPIFDHCSVSLRHRSGSSGNLSTHRRFCRRSSGSREYPLFVYIIK